MREFEESLWTEEGEVVDPAYTRARVRFYRLPALGLWLNKDEIRHRFAQAHSITGFAIHDEAGRIIVARSTRRDVGPRDALYALAESTVLSDDEVPPLRSPA